MVTLEVNGGEVVNLDYTPGMTATDLQQEFQDHKPGKHYRLHSFKLYDPSQNRQVAADDEIVDDRRYVATVWVQSIVDDEGEPIKTGII